MTALIKRLDEIDGRVAKAPADAWTGFNDDEGKLVIQGRAVWNLVRHAPADLAFLSRLVRMAAEVKCEQLHEWVDRFKREAAQGSILDLPTDRQYEEIPCGCFDGDEATA